MGRKQKYSKDLKIEICKKYISGEKSAKELSNIYDLGRYGDNLINTWVRQYQKNSSLIFEEKQKNGSYSKEFKINVVIDYLSAKDQHVNLLINTVYHQKQLCRSGF